MSGLWPHCKREPDDPGRLHLREMRGHADDADVNAAINILRAGHARLACGEIGAVRPLSEAGTLKAQLNCFWNPRSSGRGGCQGAFSII